MRFALAMGFVASLLLLALSKATTVSIHLNATMLMVNTQSLAITCHVPRHPDNRSLHYGITDYTDSFYQLDGDDSRITIGPVWYAHIPCGDHLAYCVVTRLDHTTFTASQHFEVAGCSQNP